MTYSVKQFFDDIALELREGGKQTPPLGSDLQDVYVVICNKYRGYIENNETQRDSVIRMVLNVIRGVDDSEDVIEIASGHKRSILCCCCCGLFSRSRPSQETVPILNSKQILSPDLMILEQCFLALQKNDLAKVKTNFDEIRTVKQTKKSSRRGKNSNMPQQAAPMSGDGAQLHQPNRPAPTPGDKLAKPQRPAPVPPGINF